MLRLHGPDLLRPIAKREAAPNLTNALPLFQFGSGANFCLDLPRFGALKEIVDRMLLEVFDNGLHCQHLLSCI